MTPPRDPHQYLEEAVQYRKQAAEVFENFELRDSYLALARSYEMLADALTRREPSNFGRAASIHSYELTDFEWKVIEPLLPDKPRGVPRIDDRRVLNGILWILGTGAPWYALPKEFGRYSTCHGRFVLWRKVGVWDRLLAALTKAYDGDMQRIDNSSVRVLRLAANSKDATWDRV